MRAVAKGKPLDWERVELALGYGKAVVTRACLGGVPRTLRAAASGDWHCARRMTDAGGWLLRGRAAGVSWMKAWWINELSWE